MIELIVDGDKNIVLNDDGSITSAKDCELTTPTDVCENNIENFVNIIG